VQKNGKEVFGWAFEGDHDPSQPVQSNLFEMQWPPHSGRIQLFPEVDRVQFFSLPEGKKKLMGTQWPMVERLMAILQASPAAGEQKP
jgi:predicted NUDIX family NTP pyrophosphohydrolase